MRRYGVATLAGLAVCGALAAPAHAQGRRMPIVTPAPAPITNPFFGQNRVVPFIPSLANQSINPNPYLNEFTTLGQAAFNMAVLGQALSNVPPYALGYNPQPQAVNYGASYPTAAPYGGPALPTLGAYNPYMGGGYGGGYGATVATNPYLGGYGGSPGTGGGHVSQSTPGKQPLLESPSDKRTRAFPGPGKARVPFGR